jgi:hypothetical protein
MNGPFEVASREALEKFFGTEPTETSEDGFFAFEASDERGATLRVSVDVAECSVQTLLRASGAELMRVSHEQATRLLVLGHVLRGEFQMADARTTLTIELGKCLQVHWSTLRTA